MVLIYGNFSITKGVFMNTKAIVERKKTLNDLKEKLNTYGKCCVPRCTGFGKTTMISNMIKEYDNVLYLYPTEVIKRTVEKSMSGNVVYETEDGYIKESSNVEFMTYHKLARSNDFSKYKNVDLIVLDECHRIGGEKTSKSLHLLLDSCPIAQLVGLTATPDRSDGFDVVQEFFDGICVYRYTLADAIKDGIIQKPYYCFCSYDFKADLKESALVTEEKLSEKECEQILKAHFIEIAKIHNMENIIKSVCNSYAQDTSYMKFIVFYSDLDGLSERQNKVKHWFKLAFPNHKINMVEVSSRDEDTQDVKKLDNCSYRKNTIDLINCVDMLNMGYHISDITGIVMMRGTHSSIIYTQQLGRAISSGDSHGKIVFDIVDNIHRKSYYEVLPDGDISQLYGRIESLKAKISKLRKSNASKLDIAKKEQELIYLETELNARIEGNEDLKQLLNSLKERPYSHINDLYIEDLIAVGNIATERELIAKCIAETLSARCRKAFAKWVNAKAIHDKKYIDVSDEKVIRQFVQENNITKESILDIERTYSKGSKLQEIPLSPFCKNENTSVNSVLKLMEKEGYFGLKYQHSRQVV